MNVEFTGRQYEVTPAVRKQVQHGLEKLSKILSTAAKAYEDIDHQLAEALRSADKADGSGKQGPRR